VNGSASAVALPAESVDYVFTDHLRIKYLLFRTEPALGAWIGKLTDTTEEAVVHRKNDGGTKRLPDYARLMQMAFCERFRVLKPGRWATVNSTTQMVPCLRRSRSDPECRF